jgi:hypothetical protein
LTALIYHDFGFVSQACSQSKNILMRKIFLAFLFLMIVCEVESEDHSELSDGENWDSSLCLEKVVISGNFSA